jgi:threonine dehydratase
MSELHLPTVAEVEAARANILGVAVRTPLWKLNVDVPGANIYLKLENLQPLGSFKIRAAHNAVKCADPASLKDGVVGASAGNFGQGLTWAAKQLGVEVTIVSPDSAAKTKTDALEALGAKVIRIPFEDWWQVLLARKFEGVSGVFFHPVAEQPVVAGNATIGEEIFEDLPGIDTVIVPVGGGGLISGIGSVMRRRKPGVRVLAAESEAAQPIAAALEAGKPVRVPHLPSFIDGMGSAIVLDEMWPLIRQTVDGAVRASFDEIAAAIRLLATKHHVIAEGAGASSLAAALSGRAGGGNIVCVISGGNIDASRLTPILEGKTPWPS